jgi:periplasmic protein TonB
MNASGKKSSPLKASLALHGAALLLALSVPLFLRACDRKRSNEKLTFVEFTVSIPPPASPDAPDDPPPPEPVPPPKPVEEIRVPDKKPPPKPEPPKPAPPKPTIQKGKRVTRNLPPAPPPKDDPKLTPEEIARRLKLGARPDTTTSAIDEKDIPMAAYFEHVRARMHAVWDQPPELRNLMGLRTGVTISVTPQGRIVGRSVVRSSGNALMDQSVLAAIDKTRLRPLPVGHARTTDIEITFEISN